MAKKIFLAWLFLIVNMPALTFPAQGQEVIRVATVDYPPYVIPSLKHHGVLGQIVTEAFELEGIKVEFGFFPDKRAYKLTESGVYDATMPWAKRDERLAFFFYGEPLVESDREIFLFRNGLQFKWDPKKQNYEDIKGMTFGAIIGFNYGQKFMEAERNGTIRVFRLVDTLSSLRMLNQERIDLMISPEKVALHALKTHFTEDSIKEIRSTLAIDEAIEYDYLLISKRSAKGEFFLKAMNRGLRKLKESGRHDAIIGAFNREFETLSLPASRGK